LGNGTIYRNTATRA